MCKYRVGICVKCLDSMRGASECEEYDKFAELHEGEDNEITPFSREWVTKHVGDGIESSVVVVRLLLCPRCDDGTGGERRWMRPGQLSRLVDENTSDLAGSFVLKGLTGDPIASWGKRRPRDEDTPRGKSSRELLEAMNVPAELASDNASVRGVPITNRDALNSMHKLTPTSEIPPCEPLPAAVMTGSD